MELSPFIDALRTDLAASADAAGPDARAGAERVLHALDPAMRLVLLDAVTAAAAEVGSQLDDAAVEIRLRGRDPQLVVLGIEPPGPTAPPAPPVPPTPPTPPAPPEVDGPDGTARLTLRLPEGLKSRAEQAAEQAGLSVNAWLVRAVTAALEPAPVWTDPGRPGRPGRRLSGWAR